MLVLKHITVAYGRKTTGADTRKLEGEATILDPRSSIEDAFEDIQEGIEAGKLPAWDKLVVYLNAGIVLKARQEIKQAQVPSERKTVPKAVEAEIIRQAVLQDVEAWVQVCKSGRTETYVKTMYADIAKILAETPTVAEIERTFKQVLEAAQAA